ncbi:uncharacterized protein TRUGW13939_08758 [Talaromyces rugulosus]|uniref:2-isopropylmalate synthase n=1 Tax=Talaromyces rugulosus TaxID=121627 RepID=A0A7H8R5Y3_TALRU|nr:uncharacterized protein TRUGW13939_08758 [Talaromyces rugulosus]QKX61606.1 hypothetical protein TRUGW13939_08758 [Talaromyces rugulosus]
MPMLEDPSQKYQQFAAPELPDRTWPSKKLTKRPRWLATDLRDGNQALAKPLDFDQKWTFFQMLLRIGFKEIEVGFPGASDTDFNFTKRCVAEAPEDVWIEVMTPCRKDFIRRTIDSVTGAKKVIISLYIATSDNFISTVFETTREAQFRTAMEHVAYLRSITKDDPTQQATTWNLMWSPEAFSDTDTTFAIEICRAVKDIWGPSEEVPIILNLPATVEMSSPNTYADQVEMFIRGIADPVKACVSLHPHNDRGCAVAAAELGQLAGATRVEGCLFGNGERTGNVDLVTLALNLYSQGIDPGLDFSDLPAIRKTAEELTHIPVHTRAPYAGDSVFLAYSGGHQDAIRKGFKKWNQLEGGPRLWKIPYIPIDPNDIGSSYEAVIRVNSQSGKGGIAWVLQHALDLDLPKDLLQSFSLAVKSESEKKGRTLESNEITKLFLENYHVLDKDPRVLAYQKTNDIAKTLTTVRAIVLIRNLPREVVGHGATPLDAVSFSLSAFANSRFDFESVWGNVTLEDGQVRKIAVVKCTSSSRSTWSVKTAGTMEEAQLLAALSAALDWQKDIPAQHQRLRLLPIVEVAAYAG